MTSIYKTAKVAAKSRPQAASGSRAPAGRNSENVKTDGAPKSKKQASTPPPKLVRTTFTTSREMDFFSEKELVTQTGHDISEWPLVFAKETIDNALDAAEEADIAPVIKVVADATGITVKDNGPGLPEATLKMQLDFRVRASNRDVYVAPDRGKQGNALKTLLPMPVIVDPNHGKLIVMAHGKRHVITCGADPISQRPIILDDVTERPTAGTEIRIEWAAQSDSYGEIAQRLTSVSDYAREKDLVKYEFQNKIQVYDLGLRLVDAKAYGLKDERFQFKGHFSWDTLATEEEQEFLRSNRRIELNAFTAPQFIEWIETQLTAHMGGERLIPPDDVLAQAYRRAIVAARLNQTIEGVLNL
jgi:hypothetical protein